MSKPSIDMIDRALHVAVINRDDVIGSAEKYNAWSAHIDRLLDKRNELRMDNSMATMA